VGTAHHRSTLDSQWLVGGAHPTERFTSKVVSMVKRIVKLLFLLGCFMVATRLVSPSGLIVPAIAEEETTDLAQDVRTDFDSRIAPLLARRCLACHGSSEPKGELNLSRSQTAFAGGESGKAIIPGRVDKSLLWERVSADEMPPKKPLTNKEKKLLKTWIASGAKWGTDPIDSLRYSSEVRAGYDWWALQPVIRPQLPDVKNTKWIVNPIDRFVLHRLERTGLIPSPKADRRTLIRRLSFDLLGLPPSPEEVATFVNDRSGDAYSRLVNRLLDSPHYGERWARHWLDVIRFGESQGFERDKLRPNSWRFRDWVVRAFNDDMPYDEFVRMQLAGDVQRPHDSDAIIATGFLVAGTYDEVGQSQQSAAMKAVVIQDELEDIVSAVGQTFLGLTVNCARCHDHKFDPVTQVEYYRLASALSGVRHGERDVTGEALKKLVAGQTKTIQSQIDLLSRQLAVIDEPVRRKILAERKKQPKPTATPPEPYAQWDFQSELKDQSGTLHVTLHGEATLQDEGLVLNGKTAYAATVPIKRDLAEKTLEAWVSLVNLNQRGGGLVSLQTLDGRTFDAIVFGEKETRRWMAGSNGFVRTKIFNGSEEIEAHKQFIHMAIVYQSDGTITGYRNGRPYGKPYKSSGPVTFQAGKTHVVFGMRHAPPGGNRMLAGAIGRARLYDRALSPQEVAASAGVPFNSVSQQELLARLTAAQKTRHEQISFELSHLAELKSRAGSTRVYAVTPKQPEPTHLLTRGNPALKGAVVTPGGIASLKGVEHDFSFSPDAPEAKRRIKLSDWITDRNNPLFARVMVNRMWHYHFGAGLVETPSDFGFNGGRPSHPELIDWLAVELMRNNYSLKQLHRLIVTSATYRQTSRNNPAAAKIDADNRLLWRKSPLRLEAEAVRDAMLAVSGKLNDDIGGPGYYDFTTFVHNTQFYFPVDPVGESFYRRSLYRTWVRSGRNRFLDVFDCPDPSTKSPKRAVTTTPLQALSLMNNSFVLRMSDRFAERLQRESGKKTDQQIRRAYQLSYARDPDDEELNLTSRFVNQHGLSAMCRVIFNSSEFLYVD
jgi:hypothetical protein